MKRYRHYRITVKYTDVTSPEKRVKARLSIKMPVIMNVTEELSWLHQYAIEALRHKYGHSIIVDDPHIEEYEDVFTFLDE